MKQRFTALATILFAVIVMFVFPDAHRASAKPVPMPSAEMLATTAGQIEKDMLHLDSLEACSCTMPDDESSNTLTAQSLISRISNRAHAIEDSLAHTSSNSEALHASLTNAEGIHQMIVSIARDISKLSTLDACTTPNCTVSDTEEVCGSENCMIGKADLLVRLSLRRAQLHKLL